MSMLAKDFTHAARSLARAPVFAAIAVATLALGIGASAAIFSVVNAVLLRPLPYNDAERLVLIWADLRNRDVLDFPSPPGDLHDLREQTTSFGGIAGVSSGRATIAGDDGQPEQIRIAAGTPDLFDVLGSRMLFGRGFEEADGVLPPPPDSLNPNPVFPATTVVLSHGFWQRRYAGDRGVLGRTIQLGGGNAVIVGVLAPEFELLFPPSVSIERVPDVVLAARLNFQGSRINVSQRMIGRLKPGVSIERAQADVEVVAGDLRARFPVKQTAGLHFRVERMHEDLVADVRPAILALMGAVVFVLLIACANVANLLLVRASARERELAVRAALGGSRWRLVRQMLAESALLAGAGTLLGLLLARLGVRLLLVLRPSDLPRIESITVDPVVLAFAVLAAMTSVLVFGVLPALRASRTDVATTLREAGRSPTLAAGRTVRNGVIVAEVALSFVLLIGCGLMIRSFIALQNANPGYDPNGVLTFALNPSPQAFQGAERRSVFVQEMRRRLGALSGVTAVTAASPLPLDGTSMGTARWGHAEAQADPNLFRQTDVRTVLPGYFEAMRTPVLGGRTFTEADNTPDQRLLVVDERFANIAFPDGNAVGKRILFRIRTDEPEWFEIIGVVPHQRHVTLGEDGREAVFVSDAVLGFGRTDRWAVRTTGDAAALAPAVRASVAEMDPFSPLADVQPMDVLVHRAQAPTRFALVLIGIFAGIAALLAGVGLYGVLSTVVRQRTPEIGVRLAFGATRERIFRLVVGQGLRLSAAGIAIGLLVALAVTRVMSSMLVEVRPTDPLTFATMAVVFFLIAGIACWIPAHRAAGLQPTRALREE